MFWGSLELYAETLSVEDGLAVLMQLESAFCHGKFFNGDLSCNWGLDVYHQVYWW